MMPLICVAAYLLIGTFWAGVFFACLWISYEDNKVFPPSWRWIYVVVKALVCWPWAMRIFLSDHARD